VHGIQQQSQHRIPCFDSHWIRILQEFSGRDQEVNVVGIPGFFKNFADGEDRSTEASDLINGWIVVDGFQASSSERMSPP